MPPMQPEPADIEGIEDAAKAAEETAERHPFRTVLIVGTLVTLASVMLNIQNTNDVQLKWLFLDFSGPSG